MNDIIRLAAAYTLADVEMQSAIAAALHIPLADVLAASRALGVTPDQLNNLADIFVEGGGEEMTLQEMLDEMDDINPDHTYDHNWEAKRDLVDEFNEDYFGHDD